MAAHILAIDENIPLLFRKRQGWMLGLDTLSQLDISHIELDQYQCYNSHQDTEKKRKYKSDLNP